MCLAWPLPACEMRAEPLEFAALAACEHDDLVVVCVVRLHIDEPACLLLHWNLLSSPDVAATVPRDGPALHALSGACVRRLAHADAEWSRCCEADRHHEGAGGGVKDVVVPSHD